jgi:hypothetical protein
VGGVAGSEVAGLKFRRQQPLRQFIVDSYCVERRLIVEVDGSIMARFMTNLRSSSTTPPATLGYKPAATTSWACRHIW